MALACRVLDEASLHMMKKLIGLSLLAGCTVMVNGKPRRIGGGSDPEPAQQTAQAPASKSPAAAPASIPVLPPGQIIKIDQSIGRDPLVVSTQASFDTSFTKMFGYNVRSPDCSAYDMPSRPIASLEISQLDADLNVAVLGGRNDGFIIRKGDLFWSNCDATMGPPQEKWQPGRYDIYPLGNAYGKPKTETYQIELYRPNAQQAGPGSDSAQKLVISGKLDKPMFVEVNVKANRRVLRREHAGDGCEKIALAATPELALTIERPIPGLVIRPLPSATPITMRLEKPGDEKHRERKYCIDRREGYSNGKQPSYSTKSELHFDKDDEGTFAVSFGTPTNEELKVTLLVYDDSTKLDAMYVRPFGGENPTLEQRWVGYQMPQMNTSGLGAADDYADAEQDARVFAAVPKQALVYAKLTFDKDLGGADGFPLKNEPLVLLGLENERATVMTADGLRFYVKASHLVLAPDGPVELPKAPRSRGKEMDIGKTIAMLPPAHKKQGEAHYAKVKAREVCQDRAWEPYRRQLPSYTRPAGVDIVVYKSARTKQIEEAGERAMDSKCGTDEAFAKKTEQTRVKLATLVEQGRAKLLAEATANLK